MTLIIKASIFKYTMQIIHKYNITLYMSVLVQFEWPIYHSKSTTLFHELFTLSQIFALQCKLHISMPLTDIYYKVFLRHYMAIKS